MTGRARQIVLAHKGVLFLAKLSCVLGRVRAVPWRMRGANAQSNGAENDLPSSVQYRVPPRMNSDDSAYPPLHAAKMRLPVLSTS
jgi:hypothetical protein